MQATHNTATQRHQDFLNLNMVSSNATCTLQERALREP